MGDDIEMATADIFIMLVGTKDKLSSIGYKYLWKTLILKNKTHKKHY